MNTSFDLHSLPKVDKFYRYKIGFLFYVVYIILSQMSVFLFKNSLQETNPFFQSYLQVSALIINLILSLFMDQCMSKQSRDTVNIFRYYIPEWKDASEQPHKGGISNFLAVSKQFIIFEGSEEKYHKEIHKIGFFLMILLYFSLAFFQIAQNETKLGLLPIFYFICSVFLIMVLRLFLLNLQKIDWLSFIAFLIVTVGVGFLFKYELDIYLANPDTGKLKVYVFSAIGGLFFGAFSICLKYYYNKYCNYFQYTLVFGYCGLYCIITMPLFLCILAMFGLEIDMTITINTVWRYISHFILSVAKTVTFAHCIISLSPLVFNFGLLVNVGINLTIHVILKNFEFNYTFIVGIVLLFIALILCALSKYIKKIKKQKDKEQEKKKHEEEKNKNKNKIPFAKKEEIDDSWNENEFEDIKTKKKIILEPLIQAEDLIIHNDY